MSALYDVLLERELGAIAPAARAFIEEHSLEELWTAVARFAVLAHAPSQHGKRAVLAVVAAHDVLTPAIVIECARYAAESRPPWSEPPIFEARPLPSWDELRPRARGDALLILDAAAELEQRLGPKGRPALVHMVEEELAASSDHPSEPLEVLLDRAIAARGAVDAVRDVFVAASGLPVLREARPLEPYSLARDYAQTLIAHSVARKLPARADEFLAAVHDNLENGESYAEWSFA